MKPSRLIDVLHIWGLVVMALIVFAIIAGLPFSLRC